MSTTTVPASLQPTPDFADPITQAAHIDKAADLLEQVGMHAGDFYPGAIHGRNYQPGMPVCMLGAIALACGADEPITSAIPTPLLKRLLTELGYVNELQAYEWADKHPLGDVSLLLRGVAISIRRLSARAAAGALAEPRGWGIFGRLAQTYELPVSWLHRQVKAGRIASRTMRIGGRTHVLISEVDLVGLLSETTGPGQQT